MLKYNIGRILKARGIDRPFGYLTNEGFSKSFASRIRDNRVNQLQNKDIEKLCLALGCTPNDLFDWTPDGRTERYKDHPMQQLNREGKEIDLNETLSSIPVDKLEAVQKLIAKEIEKGVNERKNIDEGKEDIDEGKS